MAARAAATVVLVAVSAAVPAVGNALIGADDTGPKLGIQTASKRNGPA